MDGQLSNSDLAPTPVEKRTWSKWNLAALWVGMSVCIPTYTLASGMVVSGMSWKVVVAAIALGNVIVLIPMVLSAHAGTRYGLPFPVLLRAPFGVLGSNIPALLRALVACGWFGIQTWIGAKAIYILIGVLWPGAPTLPMLPAWFGITTGEFICFMGFWALNVAIIVRGLDTIRVLETYAAPLLLAMGIALFVWAGMRVESFGDIFVEPENTKTDFGAVFGVGLTLGVAFWGTLALNIPDFSRFARSQKDQMVGQAMGLPLTMALFTFIAAVVTNATLTIFGEHVADPAVLLGKIGGPVLTVVAMLGLIIATLTTNLAANVVSPANDFSNLSPRKISFRTGALMASVLGIVFMPWKLYQDSANYLFTWLLGYGAMLGAVGGIMLADYYIIRRRKLHVEDLYRRGGRYEYRGGFNPIAIVALFTGVAPCVPGFLGRLGVIEPGAFFSSMYNGAWFVAFFVAAVTHLVGMKLIRTGTDK